MFQWKDIKRRQRIIYLPYWKKGNLVKMFIQGSIQWRHFPSPSSVTRPTHAKATEWVWQRYEVCLRMTGSRYRSPAPNGVSQESNMEGNARLLTLLSSPLSLVLSSPLTAPLRGEFLWVPEFYRYKATGGLCAVHLLGSDLEHHTIFSLPNCSTGSPLRQSQMVRGTEVRCTGNTMRGAC